MYQLEEILPLAADLDWGCGDAAGVQPHPLGPIYSRSVALTVKEALPPGRAQLVLSSLV